MLINERIKSSCFESCARANLLGGLAAIRKREASSFKR
jgi:hypothetical protein